MRKIFNILFLFPIAIVLILLSVANRQHVQFSLDPLNSSEPALAVTLPFFVFLFGALLLGALLGGLVTWISQGQTRKELRKQKSEVGKLKLENEQAQGKMKSQQKEIAPGLPLASLPDKTS